MISVKPVSALRDNYIWLIETTNKHCICVDPGDAQPVIERIEAENLILDAIFITHHHWDHTNGIENLVFQYDIHVYGPDRERPSTCHYPLKDNDTIEIEGYPVFTVIDIPGHTLGHIAYYTPGVLFCGDTLFTAGCGRVFEGTMSQMLSSLDRLQSLPEDTQVYCGHEYTQNNLKFAQLIEPENTNVRNREQQVAALRQINQPSVPATLAEECLTNPFLRVRESTVIKAAEERVGKKLTNPVDIFTAIREWKDSF